MNCCEKCFMHRVIKDMIRGLNKKGNCDYCKSKNVFIYDLQTDIGLDSKFNGILGVFRKRDELPAEYPTRKLGLIKDELVKSCNIFSSDFPLHLVADFLKELLQINYPMKVELLNETVGVFEYVNPSYLNENALLKGNTWNIFVDYIKHKNRFHSRHINYSVLKEYLEGMAITLNKNKIFYRARISNKEELNLDKMYAPLAEFAQAGRANSAGISHLYLATDIETVIKEIRPKTKDTIYVGKFILEQDIKIIDFRRLNKIGIFDFEDDPAKYLINFENFNKLSEEISKPIKSGDSLLDYLPTQFIVDYIKSLNDFEMREEDIPYSGIAFHSTLSTTGYNLMSFEKEPFKCIEVMKTEIKAITYDHVIFEE